MSVEPIESESASRLAASPPHPISEIWVSLSANPGAMIAAIALAAEAARNRLIHA